MLMSVLMMTTTAIPMMTITVFKRLRNDYDDNGNDEDGDEVGVEDVGNNIDDDNN